MASEYLVPNIKTWPTSMPRQISRVPLPSGEASPTRTLRKSAAMDCGKSLFQLTPFKWKPLSLAPQIQSDISATVKSAIT